MNKHTEVLSFLYSEVTHSILKITRTIHPAYAPIGITEYKAGISLGLLSAWWRNRAIPASRSKLQETLDKLNITTSIELLEKCFGLGLSDQYWVKEITSSITWNEINFFCNPFSGDIGKLMLEETVYIDEPNLSSPDNSSQGNLRKKWKIIKGKRCLIKTGNTLNNQEPFNEVIATKLYERILDEEDYVPYYLMEDHGIFYSCCETMVSTDEELVPAIHLDAMTKLRGSDSLYKHYIEACTKLNIPHVKSKIDKMIVCDYILGNFDRHYHNFGAIRNVNNLKWMKIAPLFDDGSSLWATTPTTLIGSPYNNKPFMSNARMQLNLVNDYSLLNVDKFHGFERDIHNVLSLNPFMDEPRITAIINQVHMRIKEVIEYSKSVY